MTPAFLIPKDVADPVLLDHALPIEEAQFGRGGLASTVEDCEAAPLPKRCLQLQKCSFSLLGTHQTWCWKVIATEKT